MVETKLPTPPGARTLLLALGSGIWLDRPSGRRTRGTGDMGLVIERAAGRVQIVETTGRSRLWHRVEGLGDLSHASTVFSRDGRYAYVFGRDGGLSKIDLLSWAAGQAGGASRQFHRRRDLARR